MPTYRIVLHRQAEKGLAKLPHGLQEKAGEFIERVLAETPLERIAGKTKELQGNLLESISTTFHAAHVFGGA